MIEPYLYAELVAFYEQGTLAKAAAQLHVTQPTVTRGMQKLEDDLGITLFDRLPNRLSLTPTGEFTAQQAARVLAQLTSLEDEIHVFAKAQTTLTIGAVIPGPLLLLQHLAAELPANSDVNGTLTPAEQTASLLTTRARQLIFSNEELQTDTLESRFIGTENLDINLDKFMQLANQPSITFAELNDLSLIVYQDIGPWQALVERELPHARIMFQPHQDDFVEIAKHSSFPYFTTNLSRFMAQNRLSANDDRVPLPLSDAAAHMPIYASYRKADRKLVTPVIDRVRQNWPQ